MRLHIRPRMIFGFSLMIILLIFVVVFAIVYSNRMQKNSVSILTANVTSQKAAEELEISLLDMKGLTAYFLMDGNSHWLNMFSDKKDSFLKWFEEARQNSHTMEEKTILDQLEELFQHYVEEQTQVIIFNKEKEKEKAIKLLTGSMRETYDIMFEKCEELLFINEKMMFNTSQQIKNDNKKINRILVAIGVIGVVLGLTLGYFITRSIVHPIYELVLKLKSASGEKIVEKIDLESKTEIEDLNVHVQNLIQKITETTDDLEKSHEMLLRSEKLASLGEMAAGLAHEIRNPLTAIQMLIFSLKNENEANKQMESDLLVIIKEINRMEVLLQNFLDFARPPEPNFSVQNLHDILDQVLNLMEVQLTANKINLEKNYYVEDIKILCDSEQLQHTFVNIILNSIQAMPDGGKIKIFTSIINDDLNEKQVQIKIQDDGAGIPAEIFPNIFDPFISSKEKGTGLGLSIVNQIVHKHNGKIEAQNLPDSGAMFIINLPLKGNLG